MSVRTKRRIQKPKLQFYLVSLVTTSYRLVGQLVRLSRSWDTRKQPSHNNLTCTTKKTCFPYYHKRVDNNSETARVPSAYVATEDGTKKDAGGARESVSWSWQCRVCRAALAYNSIDPVLSIGARCRWNCTPRGRRGRGSARAAAAGGGGARHRIFESQRGLRRYESEKQRLRPPRRSPGK